MKDYSKVSPQFWSGKTGKALKAKGQEAIIVGLYLMTCQHGNMLGMFYLPVAYIAADTGLGFEGASKGLTSACEAGFCCYDHDSEVVWVYEMALYQVADQLEAKDNRCKGIQREYDSIPENPYLAAFFDRYCSAFHMTSKRESDNGLASPSEAPPKPVAVTVAVPVAVTRTVAVAVDANAMLPGGSGEPTLAADGGKAIVTAKPKKPAKPKSEATEANIATWTAYATAYAKRYGVEPARNAAVNGMISKLVAAVGQQDAPLIARYYVNLNAEFYTRKCHDLKLLLADAQAVRTQWMTNRQVTSASARSLDKQQASLSGIDEFLRDKYGDPVDPEIKTVDAEVLS